VPLEGKLTSLTQQSNNIVFLFSGSEHHLLNVIFNEYCMPFYQSTGMGSIGKIEKKDYFQFIAGKLWLYDVFLEHFLKFAL